MQKYLKIHSNDNVAVALAPLSKGLVVELGSQTVTLSEDIPQGHKFALTDIKTDEPVIKYGSQIGLAKEDITTGSWIHTHNIRTGLGDLLTYTYEPIHPEVKKTEERFFDGYRRSNGKVGVRNEIWIVPTVGCVNNVATAVERQAQVYKKGTVEEIVAFPHPYGCSQMGDDQEHTRQILADLINHPNAGGVLVLGLGCENSNIEELKKYIGEYRYGGIITPKGIPAIIDEDLFERVQQRMALNKKAPAKGKAAKEYLLTTKLFCGTCGRLMVGESGKSRTGVMYHYYKCSGAKRHLGCKRKAIRKQWIERAAVLITVQRVLKDDEIDRIAAAIVSLQEREDTTLPAMRFQLAACEKAIDNMLNAIQQGIITASTKERLEQLETQRQELKLSILQVQMTKPRYTKEQIVSWINRFKYGSADDPQYQKQIIDTFINSIYVFDDKIVFTYNFQDGTEPITLAEIEAAFGSDLAKVAPPQTLRTDMVRRVFCYITAHPSLLFLDKVRLCSYYNYC